MLELNLKPQDILWLPDYYEFSFLFQTIDITTSKYVIGFQYEPHSNNKNLYYSLTPLKLEYPQKTGDGWARMNFDFKGNNFNPEKDMDYLISIIMEV